jgi:peptidoglycan/LPS O-acetylase OafA/YrhL
MSSTDRLHALDAVRACALLLGVMFHGGFSFIPGMIPGLWAIVDNSPSTTISVMSFAAHIFRMTLFFFVAGFFARMMYLSRKGARGFWRDRAKRILLPLVAGWIVIFPLIAAVWIWGLTKTFGGKIPPPPANMPAPPPGAFPLTHLWFLYYLLILYAIVLLVRWAIVALDRSGAIRRATDTVVRGIVRTGTAAVLLPLPVIAAMYALPEWYMWFGIPTPDRSVIPQLASLIGYGTAVAFGWLIHRQLKHEDVLSTWRRQWPMHLAAAAIATIVCLSIAGVVPVFVPAKPGAWTLTYAFAYGIAIWCWCFAVIGVAVRYLSDERPAVRYVADASYWIYLVHLPVVALFQVIVGHWPLHWTVKFPMVMVASLAVLFASYHYLVRATFIGGILNGRRYPRSLTNSAAAATAPAAAATTTAWQKGPVLASAPEPDKPR